MGGRAKDRNGVRTLQGAARFGGVEGCMDRRAESLSTLLMRGNEGQSMASPNTCSQGLDTFVGLHAGPRIHYVASSQDDPLGNFR